MKLFIAGAEKELNRIASLSANNPNLLGSYYHLTKAKHKIDDQFKQDYSRLKDSNMSFIMDSGLFTMMFGAGSKETYSEAMLQDYTDQYISNILSIGYEHYIVEMDVHKLLGVKKLEEFRRKFMLRYPIEKTIYVWHIENEIEGWRKMAKTYPYIALSIPELRIVMKAKYIKDFIAKMIRIAQEINPDIKIHLLGCTSVDLLQQSGYYSADSTSWQASFRWGKLMEPATRTIIPISAMGDMVAKAQPKIEQNEKYLQTHYGLRPPTINATQHYGVISIAFYRQMAKNICRDYYDYEYKSFDDNLVDIIHRRTNE